MLEEEGPTRHAPAAKTRWTTTAPHEVPAETIRNFGIAYGPALAVPYVAAVVALTYYRIDRKGHRMNLDELAARAQHSDRP